MHRLCSSEIAKHVGPIISLPDRDLVKLALTRSYKAQLHSSTSDELFAPLEAKPIEAQSKAVLITKHLSLMVVIIGGSTLDTSAPHSEDVVFEGKDDRFFRSKQAWSRRQIDLFAAKNDPYI